MRFPPRRTGPRTVRLLQRRIRIFGVGAVLGLAGIFLETAWLVTAALVVLLAGMAVRYTPGTDPGEASEEEPEEEPEEDPEEDPAEDPPEDPGGGGGRRVGGTGGLNRH